MTALAEQLSRFSELGLGIDMEYHMERLLSYPEGEWFRPNNADAPDYDICDRLARLNLIETHTQPIWANGACRGVHHYFRYSTTLEFT